MRESSTISHTDLGKGKSCHQAIREVNQTIMTKKVNFVVDADIKGFFDNVNHDWLMKFLEHDIQDKNFLRYIKRFLKSGIMEDMKFYESDKGTPQGGRYPPYVQMCIFTMCLTCGLTR